MKHFKAEKLLSVLLALAMIFSTLPIIRTQAAESGDYEYDVLDEAAKTCEIKKYKGSGGDVTIPSVIDGYTVTSIGNSAFYNCSSLASITISDSVTDIGDEAFQGCSSLETIAVDDNNPSYSSLDGILFDKDHTILNTYPGGKGGDYAIPDSVTKIRDSAFYNCSSLTSITIPDSVTSIGESAFEGCTSLTSVTIPDSVTYIGSQAFEDCKALASVSIGKGVTNIRNDAFSGCNSLTSVTIPDSVTYIGSDAFYGCSSLTSIIIPDSVTSIEDGAFENCKALTSITIPDSVTNIGGYAFEDCKALASVSIGKGVTSIGGHAFAYCDKMTSITIPDSVVSIGEEAFYGCESLTSITIPDSVVSIGEEAFVHCSNLETITVDDNNPSYSSLDGVLFDKDHTMLSQYPGGKEGDYTIPDSVISIRDKAFYSCGSLTSVTIPDSVTSIGGDAFRYCGALTSVTIGNSVTSIGDYAFYDCVALISVTLGKGVTNIGDYAFAFCRRLFSIVIPDSVTSIGEYAFWCCDNLKDVYYTGTEADKDKITIGEGNEGLLNATWHYDCVISDKGYVYSIIDETAKTCEIIRYTGNDSDVIIPSELDEHKVVSIGNNAFEFCNKLASITIPDSVTSIGGDVFRYCEALTCVTIGNSVTSIGDYAFAFCNALTSVAIPDSVVSIGEFAFFWCDALTSITLGKGLTSIGDYAFAACQALTSVTIPGRVISIGENAFYLCTRLTSVAIPDSVTSIGLFAFRECDDLETITVDDNNPSYSSFDGILFNKDKTELIRYPSGKDEYHYAISNNVISIGDGAFERCYSLSSIAIPDSVASIGDNAFNGCSSLTSITIPNSVTSIGESAFAWCESLTSVSIPNSVTGIDEYAFRGCSSLTSITIPASVTSIGNQAFAYCNNLTSVTIGNSVTNIGDQAFSGCDNLKDVYYTGTEADKEKITFAEQNESLLNATWHYGCVVSDKGYVYSIIDETAKTCEIIRYTGNGSDVIIPSEIDGYKVVSIGDFVFDWCDNLKDVYYIGTEADKDKITIGKGNEGLMNATWHYDCVVSDKGYIYSIIDETAKTCEIIKYTGSDDDVIIPSEIDGYKVVSIGDSAFRNCYSLKSVVIPDCVSNIKNYAFYGCYQLGDVYYIGTEADKEKITFAERNEDLLSVTWHYGCVVSDKGYIYSIIDEAAKTCEIVRYTGSDSDVTIPSELDEYKVVSIGDSAFDYYQALVSIAIPDSVTSIGDGALICVSLETITVNNNNPSYSSLDGVLFNKDQTELIRCPGGKKENYLIPSNVTSIGNCAFMFCQALTSITIPDSVTSIGKSAFLGCDGLLSIVIPDSVTSIGDSAFWGCYSLSSIVIPDRVTSIESETFYDCWDLTSVTIGNSVTSIGDNAFNGCSSLTSITIPASVTSIGRSAFGYCKALTSVAIPDSVASIGDNAFNGCSSLTSIVIPDSVTSIGYDAFGGCSCLESIIVDDNNSYYSDLDGVLFNKDQTELIQCPGGKGGDYVIPDSVTSIGAWAFASCTSLTSVIIPDSVTSIGNYAFYECENLTSIIIPDSVTSIGRSAFGYCKALTSVIIPNSVASIGDLVFIGCYSLTSVTIPNSVTSIGESAFAWCKSLTSVTIPNSVTGINEYAFRGCDNLKDVYYIGTEADKDKITVGVGNEYLLNATWNYENPVTPHVKESLNGVAQSWDDKDNSVYALYPDNLSDEDIKADLEASSVSSLSVLATDENNKYLPEKGEIVADEDGKHFNQSFSFKDVPEGNYKLGIFKPGKYIIKIFSVTVNEDTVSVDVRMRLYGDINNDGKGNYRDAVQVKRAAAGLRHLNDEEGIAGDVNFDGKANYRDAIQIMRYSAGLKPNALEKIK